jgi:hypothetical protein
MACYRIALLYLQYECTHKYSSYLVTYDGVLVGYDQKVFRTVPRQASVVMFL